MDQSARVAAPRTPPNLATLPVATFGPFRLDLAARRVEKDGLPVQIPARAVDILILLVERAGTVVGKYELIDRVWPGAPADEARLRVYVAALRKALGDGEDGSRYVVTVSGQGYCLAMEISYPPVPQNRPSDVGNLHKLPARRVRIVGRDDSVRDLSDQLIDTRFVTLVGPGGIGKTTVAIATGYELLAEFAGAVYFIDLGSLSDPILVPNVIASTLGLFGLAADPVDGLVAYLRGKRTLLILDCCEHVIDAAALLAERIWREVPDLFVLATSREPLRVEGEHVHRLLPLETPPEQASLTASQALAFPAVQLFVERAAATDGRFRLNDANAHLVGEICYRLDGIALAIELASSRSAVAGLQETFGLLSERLDFPGGKAQQATPRHQTLRATLDWSYKLLSEEERVWFRRLSAFSGTFTLEAANRVAAATGDGEMPFASTLGGLVVKSLLSATSERGSIRYRLLDATRTYAAEQLSAAGEENTIAHRHALYFTELLERTSNSLNNEDHAQSFTAIADQIGNVRAALAWCFSESGSVVTGVALAAASMPMLLELALLSECQVWARRALHQQIPGQLSKQHDLSLHAALGLALMHTQGNSDEVLSCLSKALSTAELINSTADQVRLLERLHVFHLRKGKYTEGLGYAQRALAIAMDGGDTSQIAHMQIAVGASLHLAGETGSARSSVESALAQLWQARSVSHDQLNFDYPSRARLTLSRVLWLQGYPDQSVQLAKQALSDVVAVGHPAKLSMAIVWGFTTFVWNQEPQSCEEYIDRLRADADKHMLGPYKTIGDAAKGVVLMAKGALDEGFALLRSAISDMRRQNFRPYADLNLPMAEALAGIGKYKEALATINQASIEALCVMPEVLRIKADVLLAAPDSDVVEAERCLVESLKLAKNQSALGWELRSATSLARLRMRQGKVQEARDVLAPVYVRITEGFTTRGVKAARSLLDELDTHPSVQIEPPLPSSVQY